MDFLIPELKIGFEVKTKVQSSYMKKLNFLSSQLKLKDHYLITKEFSEMGKTILAMDI